MFRKYNCLEIALQIEITLWHRRSPVSLKKVFKRCSQEKVFRKYTGNLQENTHAEVRFQKKCFATLLNSYFNTGILL